MQLPDAARGGAIQVDSGLGESGGFCCQAPPDPA